MNRFLTTSGGWSCNSKHSRCSKCRNKGSAMRKSEDNESCEECNMLLNGNNSLIIQRNSKSNDLPIDKKIKQFQITGSGTPSFTYEKINLKNIKNIKRQDNIKEENNFVGDILSPRQIQTSI